MSPIRHRLLGLLALTSIAGAIACGGSNSTAPAAPDQRAALTKAQAQWDAAAVHDYNYDFVRDQFGQHDSVQVQVRNDQVTLATSYLSKQATSVGTGIPDLFSTLDDAISTGLTVGVTYDPQLGYPARGNVTTTTPGGGTSWKVVNFARVP